MDGYRQTYALYLLQEGRNDDAIRELERIAKATPDDRAARTRLIAAYRSMNRSDEARKVLTEVLNKNKKDFDALLQRGEMYLGNGKLQEAETDLTQVIRAN